MARLKARHKRFIVKRLAVFDRPSDVRDELKTEYGVDVDLSQLAHYDPTTSKGQKLAADLTELFHRTRERFLDEFTGSAVQHKAVRLRLIQEAVNKLRDMHNYPDMLEALEQAAKEMGGAFTNHRTTDVTNTDNIDWDELTDEQVERIADGEPIQQVLADAGTG